jgi:ATP synthase protein I
MAKDDRPSSADAHVDSADAHVDSAHVDSALVSNAAQTRQQFTSMLRGSLVPTLVVGVLAVALAAVLADGRAVGSAALGAGVVAVFFSLSLLVMRQTAHLEPVAVMAVVLATYTAKILALGVVMIVLRDAEWVSGQALALSIIGCTVVWLAFEMRAFTRMRVLVAPNAASEPPASREEEQP